MNAFKYPRWLPIVWAGLFFGLAGYVLLSSDSPKAHSSSKVTTTASLNQAKGLPSPTVFRGRGVGGEGQQETTYITKPIRDVQVGDWVLAENPELSGVEFEEQIVDEATWRSVEFEMLKPNGGLLRMTFLRPAAWLHANQIELGSTIDLNLEEISAKGPASVRAIGPCPQLLPRPGPRHQLVTGKYQHSADKILNVYVEGLSGPIGTTPEHPFWSEDRQAFVEAGMLHVGEKLRTAHGTLANVLRVQASATASVYNLEVNNQHVFFISSNALLVHNRYEIPSVAYHGTDIQSAVHLLNRGGLDAAEAAARKLDGPPGFFLATDAGDAALFAARRRGTVLEVHFSDEARSRLLDSGSVRQSIPSGGPQSLSTVGDEIIISPDQFDLFNELQRNGEIVIVPGRL